MNIETCKCSQRHVPYSDHIRQLLYNEKKLIDVKFSFMIQLKISKIVFYLLIGIGGFLPAMKQIGNVAALPGIVKVCLMFIA